MRAWTFTFFALPALALAHVCPETTAVVVNGSSWASVTIANEYVRLRNIPSQNVIVLPQVSQIEALGIQEFRNEILGPVFRALGERGIRSQIDCITYSTDLPYAVHVAADVNGRTLPQIITPVASANGLTYLNELVEAKNIDYLRLDINSYARQQIPVPTGKPLSPAEQEAYAQAMSLYDQKKYREAATKLRELLTEKRRDSSIAYNLACCLSLAGRADEAVEALTVAVRSGYRNYTQAESDSDLRPLMNREDMLDLLKLMRTARIDVQAGVPFSAATGWNLEGEPSANGSHYILSTFLGLTYGRGNSVEEVLECLRRAKKADGTAPKGTVYYEKNGDVRATTRQWGFEPAAERLRQLGVQATVEQGVLPQKRADVAGGMIGIADFDWSASGSTMLPGAIVEHLTSLGGIITENGGQTPCTDFIRAGAAGSSGTVTEPYALQEKFPSPFMHVHYAKGFCLAEAFAMSLAGPYQLLIIGDPLCRPWAKPPVVKFGPWKPGQTKLSVTSTPSSKDVTLYVDGKLLGSNASGSFTLSAKQLAPGTHIATAIVGGPEPSRAPGRAQLAFAVPCPVTTVVAAKSVPFGHPIPVTTKGPAGCKFTLRQYGRVIATLGTGSGSVPSSELGIGQVRLDVTAQAGGKTWTCSPLLVQVDPPEAAVGKGIAGTVPGFRLSVAGGPAVIVKDLSELPGKVPSNTAFELEGVFAGSPGLTQIHLWSQTTINLKVDGGLSHDFSPGHAFWPLQLPVGAHTFVLSGRTGAQPLTLDWRMGVRGTPRVTAANFSCQP